METCFEENYKKLRSAGFLAATKPDEPVRALIKTIADQTYCIILWNNAATQVSTERIDTVSASLKSTFLARGMGNVPVLNLIYVGDVSFGRSYLANGNFTWIVDSALGEVYVFDGQPDEFAGVRAMLEGRVSTAVKKRALPYVNYAFVVVNILVWVIMEIIGNTTSTRFLINHGALNVDLVVEDHEIYRIFTSMFMHGGFTHLFNNMLVLLYIGDNLERAVGHKKYLLMYLLGGIMANIFALICYGIGDLNVCCVGASGAIFSVIGALLYIVIVNRGRLEDLTTSKLVIYIALSLYLGFTSTTTSNSAHIGGLLAGIVLAWFIYRGKKGTSL